MRKPLVFVSALLLVSLLLGALKLARIFFPAGASTKPKSIRLNSPSSATRAEADDLYRRVAKAKWEDAIKSSRWIIVARCVVANSDIASFQALETIKGDKSESGVIWLRYGPVSPGEEAVLFLSDEKSADNRIITPLKAIRIYSGAGSGKFVNQDISGLELFHAKDGSLYTDKPQSYPLEDFLFSVKRLM